MLNKSKNKEDVTVKKLQQLRKENPNNYAFGMKARAYLEALDAGKNYKEPNVTL